MKKAERFKDGDKVKVIFNLLNHEKLCLEGIVGYVGNKICGEESNVLAVDVIGNDKKLSVLVYDGKYWDVAYTDLLDFRMVREIEKPKRI